MQQSELPSAGEKARFFTQLDAVVTREEEERQRDRRRWRRRAAALARGSSSAAPIELSDSEDDGDGNAAEMPKRKRPATTSPSGKRRKQQKTAPAMKTATDAQRALLLQGRRVLVVPIGTDVSRKRVEIWQEMVEKLGGSPVAVVASAGVDWREVDVVVASAQLERWKAHEYYQTPTFPPEQVAARVKVYTPEWLAFLMRERKLPEHEDAFEWTYLRQQLEAEQKHREEVAAARAIAAADGDEDDDSLAADEGSDIQLRGTQEIQRAPPVHLDEEKLRREEEELQKRKDALVKERTPIFFANNPGFHSVADEPDDKPMRAEAFACQKSSSA